jgi:SPP1 family predicted phage head-tail adaptor
MKLGNRITNPGDLRTLVTIQNPTINTGAGHAQTVSWSDVETVYAKWTNAHGQDVLTSDALKAVLRATVLIRYNAAVTGRSAILKDGERWKVIGSPDDIQDRHEYMELVVELAKATV